MGLYSDPILARIISILNAEGPQDLKGRYYQGDPVKVTSKSQLPAAFVTWDETNVDNNTNAEDESRMPAVINVVGDLTRDWNQAFDKIGSMSGLWEWIQARDADYALRSDSILYVLRKYQQLGDRLWINMGTPIKVSYGIGMQKRGPGMFSVEAVIHIEVRHHQIRPGY